MLKKNYLKILISSLFTLSPMVFGLIMWNKLPPTMATHWGGDGKVDGMSSRGFAVFALPLIMLLLNIFVILISSLDKKNKSQNAKAFNMIYYFIPITSIFTNAMVYAAAFNKIWDLSVLFPIFVGLLFAIMGNITPKIRQNTTLGIKLKWTLQSQENWNATHRFGGKVMFISGLVILFTSFFPFIVMMITTLVMIFASLIITAVYSYLYYKKEVANNVKFEQINDVKSNKIATIISLIAIPIVLIGITFVMFTGNIGITYHKNGFTVNSEYCDKLTVKYDGIDHIELREKVSIGLKEYGFNSVKLSLGRFKNDELGTHTRYTYNSCKSVVIIKSDDKILVINDKNNALTKEIYLKISAEMGK